MRRSDHDHNLACAPTESCAQTKYRSETYSSGPSMPRFLHRRGAPGPRSVLCSRFWRWSGSRSSPRAEIVHAARGGGKNKTIPVPARPERVIQNRARTRAGLVLLLLRYGHPWPSRICRKNRTHFHRICMALCSKVPANVAQLVCTFQFDHNTFRSQK